MSDSLPDLRVKKACEEFACAQVDIDARKDLYRRYIVEDVPCVLFFDGDGSVVWRKDNEYQNTPEKLLVALSSAKKAGATIAERENDLLKRTLVSPNDPDLAIAIGNHYYETYRFAPSLESFRRAVRLLGDSDLDRTEEVLIRVAYLEIVLGHADAALKEIDQFLADRPRSPRRDTIAFYRGYAAYDRRDYVRAAEEWKEFLRKYPASPLRPDVEEYLASLGH